MSNNSDYTTGNLLDYAYYKKHFRLIAVDLSKQAKLNDPQKIKFKKYWSSNIFYRRKIRRNYFQLFTKFCHNSINKGNAKDCKLIKRL